MNWPVADGADVVLLWPITKYERVSVAYKWLQKKPLLSDLLQTPYRLLLIYVLFSDNLQRV